MSADEKDAYLDCSFVSIHYIICECGETFPSENGLKAHLEKEHPHKKERKEFKCGVCGEIFNTEDDCIAHYEDAHIIDIKHEAEDEGEEIETKPDHPLLHAELHEDDQMIDDGLVMDENDDNDDNEQIENQLANSGLLSKADLIVKSVKSERSVHDQSQPGNFKQMTIKPVSSDKLIVKSVKPGRIVMKPDQVLVTAGDGGQEHQILHIPEEYGQLLQVTPDGQLVLIMNNNVEEVQPQKEKKTRTKKHYLKHIVCEVCGKKYASNAALKYHQRVHTGEKPYPCHLCPKRFAMPLFLQIHVRTHTGERPFPCPLCPKAFSNKAALLRHERVHTGEKPYECPMCLKSFTQSNSMKLHVATVHLKQPAPYKSKSRKLKAQERANKIKMSETVKTEEIVENNMVIEEDEDSEAARNIAGETAEANMYEVIESEIINDEEKEVYTVIYED